MEKQTRLTPFQVTGKTVEEIASDWTNTKMTKFEIVKHFVEICKLEEEALAREIEETKKWQHDVLELQKQNELVWAELSMTLEIVEKKDKEIQELEKRSLNLVQSIKNLKCERNHDVELGV